jgi:hypothetical protein
MRYRPLSVARTTKFEKCLKLLWVHHCLDNARWGWETRLCFRTLDEDCTRATRDLALRQNEVRVEIEYAFL